jgi:hypothetical protein
MSTRALSFHTLRTVSLTALMRCMLAGRVEVDVISRGE